MRTINKHNYEVFIIDYLEGNLSKDEVLMLFDFLDNNPTLKKEFKEFEPIELPITSTIFTNKNQLKKEIINANNIDDYIIASLENDLNEAEQELYTEYISTHPNIQEKVNRYKKTFLIPENITYPNKHQLKQKRVVPLYVSISAIAATLLLLIVFRNSILKTPTSHYVITEITPISTIKNTDSDTSAIITSTQKEVIPPSTNSNSAPFKKHKATQKNKTVPKKIIQPAQPQKALAVSKLTNTSKEELQKQEATLPNVIPQKTHTDNTELAIAKPKIKNTYSVKEYLEKEIKNKIFHKDETIKNKDILIEAINNNTFANIEIEQIEKVKRTKIKIGRFGFYRSKHINS